MKRIGWQTGLLICVIAWGANAAAFEFRGFADVTYSGATGGPQEDRNGHFALGQFDLYFAEEISDRLEVLTELVIETSDGENAIDLERLEVGYVLSDALKVRAGRFHNFLGYWNMAYHHGSQMQTTIDRPEFLRFEDDGGILPVHAVGFRATGRYRTAPLILNYGFLLSNGSQIRSGRLDPNNVTDNNPNKQISLHLRGIPAGLPELGIGISANFGRIQGFDSASNPIDVNQQIYSIDVEYIDHRVEFLSEYYAIRDSDQLGGGGSRTNAAYYAQLGWMATERIIPYARHERLSVRGADPYFRALETAGERRTLLGIRYNLTVNSSLKAEVHWAEPAAGDRFRAYKAQWAFAF